MNKFTKSCLLPLAILAISNQTLANDNADYTFGVGVGSLYSGIGVNVGIQSEADLKYISVGCVRYSSLAGETCGAGIGWVKTDLFKSASNKHGLGAYLGIVANEIKLSDNEPDYGLGLGYHYFFNGINKSGANLGITIVGSNEDVGGMIQIGYQF